MEKEQPEGQMEASSPDEEQHQEAGFRALRLASCTRSVMGQGRGKDKTA